MNACEAEENDEDVQSGRLEDEGGEGDCSDEVAGGKEASFADAIAEGAGWIGRGCVHHIVKGIEADRDGCGASGADARGENLRGAKNQERGGEVADAVSEDAGEKMPEVFREVAEACDQASCVVRFFVLGRWREGGEGNGGAEPGRERPEQNAAHAADAD